MNDEAADLGTVDTGVPGGWECLVEWGGGERTWTTKYAIVASGKAASALEPIVVKQLQSAFQSRQDRSGVRARAKRRAGQQRRGA